MFLATTPLDDFWDKNAESVLYLGEWCKLYKENYKLKCIHYNTIEYIWNNDKEVDFAINYCEEIYEKVINKLIEILNSYHNINKDYEYWNILLKPWLFTYIQIIYDKYRHIKLAKSKYPKIYTYTLHEKSYQYIGLSNTFNSNVVNSDKYNLQLYSQIIKYLGINHHDKVININDKTKRVEIKSNKKEVLLRTVSKLLNKIFNKNKVLIVSPYFKTNTIKNLIQLSLKSRFLFVFDSFKYDMSINSVIDINKRQELFNFNSESNEFENLIFETLKFNFPITYLENFSIFHEKIENLITGIPQAIFSENSLYSNELFRFYLANNISKLYFLYGQHGGGIGVDRISIVESIERSLSNTYFTFGWKEQNTKVLPMPLLSNKSKKTSKINFIMTAMPRYFYIFSYLEDGSKMLDYIHNSKIFLKNIVNDNDIVIRLYKDDYKWNIKERLLEINKNLVFDNNTNYYDQIFNAKLNIFDHMHTGYLESLSINKPTIIIIPKNIYYFRDHVKPYIKKLKDVNILFDDPIKASEFVDSIYENVDNWWLSEDVQEVREEFCFNFFRKSENWANQWINEFREYL